MILNLGKPNPKQQLFLKSKKRKVGFGGSRGGGKSWVVRVKAILLALFYPGIKILIMRRTYADLWNNHVLELRKVLEPAKIATYRDSEKAMIFPNGSRIRFGYCASESDVLQYQGQEYDIIFIDEATQFTEFMHNCLVACNRGANDFPHRIYITCNPGGVGHSWVKRLFIDRDYTEAENPEDYEFIQSKVYDNTVLMEKDPDYVHMLETLPEDMRKAWLDGDWNVFAGQYFREWRDDIHIIDPIEIPEWWRRYFAMDYGLDMLAGYWIAVDGEGQAYVYREIYQSGLIASEAAQKIKELTGGENIEQWLAPPDLWNRRNDTGRSVADIFMEQDIPLTQVDNDRINGWQDVHEWLKPYDTTDIITGEPKKAAGLRFFRNCRNVIRCLPMVQYDEHKPNDVANEPHELTHAPDAIRYFCSGRPFAGKPPEAKKHKLPPELRDTQEQGGYQTW
nr:MAG TPA: Large subunit terminase [Caudoviricetes sp.]